MQNLNRNHLKLIACATMLVDHLALILRADGAALVITRGIIGRVAFPLFGFLLVEGFYHTRSRWKYILRVAVLALISEVPYDLLFYRRPFYWRNQSVLFLLALGLLMMAALEFIQTRAKLPYALSCLLQALTVAGAALLARLLFFDYGMAGIAMLAAMKYLFLASPAAAVFTGAAVLNLVQLGFHGVASPGALLAVLPAFFYNRKRGKLRAKYAFYAFYPAHILLLLLL